MNRLLSFVAQPSNARIFGSWFCIISNKVGLQQAFKPDFDPTLANYALNISVIIQ